MSEQIELIRLAIFFSVLVICATSRIFTGAKALWSVKSQPFFRQ